jgi:hypothetical protein
MIANEKTMELQQDIENKRIVYYADEVKHLLDELDRLSERCNRQAMILRRLTPENFPNTYFICGEVGTKDINGLPEKILVVPAYGVDWNMTYQRTGKVFGPEW